MRDAWVDDLLRPQRLRGSGPVWTQLLAKAAKKFQKKMRKDPAVQGIAELVRPLPEVRCVRSTRHLGDRIETAMRTYVKGMMELYPGEDLLARCQQHTCGCPTERWKAASHATRWSYDRSQHWTV